MKNTLIKISILSLLFISIQIDCLAATLENFDIEIDKNVIHPEENLTIKIDFGRRLSEFEIDIAYDKNLFEYYSADKDINLYDNGDIVTLMYPTMSTTEPISEIEVVFKANKDITTSNPTDIKVTLQNMKDGLTNEVIDNPLLPTEKKLVVEPIYKEYKFFLEYDEKTIKPNEETKMKLILKSDMGQIYTNTKIYATVSNDVEGEAKITATDIVGVKYNILEEGWGGENGEAIGGSDVLKELILNSKFSDSGNYKITFELQDLNNSNFVIASQSFDIIVKDELTQDSNITNNIVNEIDNNLGIINNMTNSASNEIKNSSSTAESDSEEVEYKPTTLPKAGSTIYFLILPIGGILILIYCIFKKKDEDI